MGYIKWIFLAILGTVVFAALHYTLPQRDIVIVTGTEIIRQDVGGFNSIFYAGADSGNAAGVNRDLRLINTMDRNGKTRVYRNEDTGIGWPPYFKFDSADLQADAQAVTSTRTAPEWVALRHYGWRNQWISIYPNATSLKVVAGPDVRLVPVFNIAVLLGLLAVVWAIAVRVRRFGKRRIDPMLQRADTRADAFGARVRGWFGRR
jgi:hypothetical protein